MFDLPTLDSLSQRLRGAVPSYFTKARADFWPNNLVIIAKVVALGVYEGLLRAKWVYRQRFIRTATAQSLAIHGEEIGLRRLPALPASGSLTVTPTAAVSLAAGAQFVSAAGQFYLSTAAAIGSSGVALAIPVVAAQPGAAGNAPAGLTIRPVAATPGLDVDGVFSLGAGGGSDEEDIEAYRARLLEKTRSRPRGGNADDYRFWVRSTGLYDAVFVKGWQPAAGRVTIYPLKPGAGAARIPSSGDLTALAASLETLKPLCAEIVVAQAALKSIAITITGLQNDTEAVRREINAELADMFDERAAVALPGESVTFSRSWISEAVSRAAGEDRHIITLPAADVVLVAGDYPVLGAVSFA